MLTPLLRVNTTIEPIGSDRPQAGCSLGGFQRGSGVSERGVPGPGEGDTVPLAVDSERDDLPDRVQRRHPRKAVLAPPGVGELVAHGP